MGCHPRAARARAPGAHVGAAQALNTTAAGSTCCAPVRPSWALPAATRRWPTGPSTCTACGACSSRSTCSCSPSARPNAGRTPNPATATRFARARCAAPASPVCTVSTTSAAPSGGRSRGADRLSARAESRVENHRHRLAGAAGGHARQRERAGGFGLFKGGVAGRGRRGELTTRLCAVFPVLRDHQPARVVRAAMRVGPARGDRPGRRPCHGLLSRRARSARGWRGHASAEPPALREAVCNDRR